MEERVSYGIKRFDKLPLSSFVGCRLNKKSAKKGKKDREALSQVPSQLPSGFHFGSTRSTNWGIDRIRVQVSPCNEKGNVHTVSNRFKDPLTLYASLLSAALSGNSGEPRKA